MSTITDVAKEAGVSVATVSRVINDNGKVSQEAFEKVNKAIRKLNYQPNIWGRRLRRQESRMLLIFVPYIHNPYYASIVSGIEDTARASDYSTMLCITNGDSGRENEFYKLLYNGQAEGAITMCAEMEDSKLSKIAEQVPVVQCCEYCKDESISRVSINNFLAAKQVLEYLISLGHRNIGFIGSTNKFVSSEERYRGYEQAFKEAFIEADKRYIAYADNDYSYKSGTIAAQKLLSLKDRPTAIFCISDVLALGTIRVAQNLGLQITKDLSVVGFDDVEYATMMNPMLTTVSQPRYALGKVSAELLLKQISEGERGKSIFIEHEFILRDSTAMLVAE